MGDIKHIADTKKRLLHESAKMLDEQAGNFVINLKNTIHSRLDAAAAEALGFSRGYNGKWEIDHCNGRGSIITNIISNKVINLAQKTFDEIFTEEKLREIIERVEKEITKEMENGIKAQLTRDMERYMKEKLEKRAEKFAEEWIESLKIQTEFDIADPKTADTELGKAFMKMAVEDTKRKR